jgi:hypothetical protein
MRAVDETTNLLLPYILAAQAQKHVTHNEALRKLDALVQISVADRDLAAPPASPLDGQRYIVAASPSGAWSGHAGKIAAWQDGAWAIYAPREGFIAWVEDEDVAVAWSGSSWVPVGGGSLNPAPLVGVNATADTTNRLSVSSVATLFNHAGAGHQFKINKNAATDTASILFQTGFSGRAEMGLAGSDDYSFKVSPDGSAWFDAIVIDRTTGEVSFPNSSIGGGVTNGDKGDVVVSGGGATWTIDANVVTNAKLADMATQTLKGRVSAGSGDPEDLTAAQVRTAIALPNTTTAGRLARYADTAGAQGQTAGIFEDASGNVGIGTTTPGQRLVVQHAADSLSEFISGGLRATNGGIVSTYLGTGASFPNGRGNTFSGTGGTSFSVVGAGAALACNAAGASAGIRFQLVDAAATGDIEFNARGSTRIIVKGAGNVGIGGINNPVTVLDVANGPIRKRTSYTVATLPAASLGDGMETYVTDSNATLAAGHGAVVAGGGSNYVPVYSRGGQWLIG